MIDVGRWNWIVDTNEMTCKNMENEITIEMRQEGENYKGLIRDMPMNLFSKIAGFGDGEMIIEKIVKTAEEEYIKTCYERL